MRIAVHCVVAMLMTTVPAVAQAASLTGTLQLNITGTFRAQVSNGGGASCAAAVLLTPSSSGGVTFGNLSAMLVLNSGAQTKSGKGTLQPSRSAFKCTVTLPYSFSTYTTGEQLVVFYTVSGHDPGSVTCGPNGCTYTPGTYSPTAAHQLLTLPAVPANGATTTKAVSVQL